MAQKSDGAKIAIDVIGFILHLLLNIVFYAVVIFAIYKVGTTAKDFCYQVFGAYTMDEEPGLNMEITIEDGALGVASANGGDSQIGELNADSITWNGGTINIDINDYAVDIINVESFTKGSADTFKFIFTEGDDKIVEDNAYTILSTLNTDFVSEDFTAEIDGYNAVFNMEDGILSVTFTAVPEPATIAGIFGVLALAFAAYRRRK